MLGIWRQCPTTFDNTTVVGQKSCFELGQKSRFVTNKLQNTFQVKSLDKKYWKFACSIDSPSRCLEYNFLSSFFIHFIIPFGKFGPPFLGKTTTAARAALPSACWVFSYPPNSDMDYRILNVCAWSFVCVRIHTGFGHTDSKSAQHFWLTKTHKFFLCSWRGRGLNPKTLDLEFNALAIESLCTF